MTLTELSILLVLSYIVMTCLIESYKYKKWKQKLHVGTKLQRLFKIINDEFDDGHLFTITITKMGNDQVQVEYSDGSTRTYDKYFLYYEGWTIIK